MTNYFTKHLIISLLSLSLLRPLIAMESHSKRHKSESAEIQALYDQADTYVQNIPELEPPDALPLPKFLSEEEMNRELTKKLLLAIAQHDIAQVDALLKSNPNLPLELEYLENEEYDKSVIVIDFRPVNSFHAFTLAAITGQPEMIACILENIPHRKDFVLQAVGPDALKQLLLYARKISNHYECVKLLLELGIKPEVDWFELYSGTDLNTYELLLHYGAEPNGKEELTPLMHAAHDCNAELCELLLRYGANIHAQDPKNKWTALMYLAHNELVQDELRQMNTARCLLNNGACINDRDVIGWTPLMMAARGGHKALLELFIQCGADITPRDREGEDALAHAYDGFNERVDAIESVDDFRQWFDVNASDDMRVRRRSINKRYTSIFVLFNHPEKIRALILRKDNPCAQPWIRSANNIVQALQNRELGESL